MRIYTCAFEAFSSDDYFFTRDSGLLCRCFQKLDVESKVVLLARPGYVEENAADIVRAEWWDLTSSVWWKQLRIDAVVFITWGYARHTPVVEAAKASGLKVVLIGDGGISQHWDSVFKIMQTAWHRRYHLHSLRRGCETVLKSPIVYVWLKWTRRGLWKQFCCADWVSNVAPCVTQRVRQDLVRRGISPLSVFASGYPVAISENKRVSVNEVKPRSIVSVARWEAILHKRPHFLMDMCREILASNDYVEIHIYGKAVDFMYERANALPENDRKRLLIHGFCDHEEILDQMRKSEIAVCTSAFDGGPVPVAEALCAGCSVVGGGNFAGWASDEGYGTAPASDDPSDFCNAILNELDKWTCGAYDRDRNRIYWTEFFSAQRFADRIRSFLESHPEEQDDE